MMRMWGIVMFAAGLVIMLTAGTLLIFSHSVQTSNGYLTIFGIIGIGLMVLSMNLISLATRKKKR